MSALQLRGGSAESRPSFPHLAWVVVRWTQLSRRDPPRPPTAREMLRAVVMQKLAAPAPHSWAAPTPARLLQTGKVLGNRHPPGMRARTQVRCQ